MLTHLYANNLYTYLVPHSLQNAGFEGSANFYVRLHHDQLWHSTVCTLCFCILPFCLCACVLYLWLLFTPFACYAHTYVHARFFSKTTTSSACYRILTHVCTLINNLYTYLVSHYSPFCRNCRARHLKTTFFSTYVCIMTDCGLVLLAPLLLYSIIMYFRVRLPGVMVANIVCLLPYPHILMLTHLYANNLYTYHTYLVPHSSSFCWHCRKDGSTTYNSQYVCIITDCARFSLLPYFCILPFGFVRVRLISVVVVHIFRLLSHSHMLCKQSLYFSRTSFFPPLS